MFFQATGISHFFRPEKPGKRSRYLPPFVASLDRFEWPRHCPATLHDIHVGCLRSAYGNVLLNIARCG
jgi:hypothetical protein